MGKNFVLGWWRGEEWKKSQEEIRAARGATRRRSWGLALAALLCIAFGGAFRQYDQTWMCTSWFGPSHWFQAHAMWHVMCAFAILLLYFFFRSEIFFFNTEKFGGREEKWEERERKSGGRESSEGGMQMELYIIDRKSSGGGIGEIL